MSTFTPDYNLEKPSSSDAFGDFLASYNSNMDIIDQIADNAGDRRYKFKETEMTMRNLIDSIVTDSNRDADCRKINTAPVQLS